MFHLGLIVCANLKVKVKVYFETSVFGLKYCFNKTAAYVKIKIDASNSVEFNLQEIKRVRQSFFYILTIFFFFNFSN